MDITYLGHSSFKIKGKTATVVTDPFDPAMVGLPYSKTETDIVTISHDHKDHNSLDRIINYKKVIEAPGEYEVMGVSIIGVRSFHDAEKGAQRGKNTIYVYEIDGIRVAHLGDLGHKLSESVIEEIGDIDVLMVPVGGIYTISATDAQEVVRAIEPSIIIPMHFFADGMNTETFGKLSKVDEFLKGMELPVEKLEKLSVKKEDLKEEQKVVVLERK